VSLLPKSFPRDIFLVADSVNELGGITSWLHFTARLFSEYGYKPRVIGIAIPQTPQDLEQNLPYQVSTLYDTFPLQGGKRFGADKLSALFSSATGNGIIIVTQVWAMEWVRLADTAGMPVVAMSHESYEYSRQCSRLSRIRESYAEADKMVVLTSEDAARWTEDGMARVVYISNPAPLWPAIPSPLTGKVILSMGRLHDQKGIDTLLDTWALVANRRSGWRLKIYGSGPDENILKARCGQLGLDSTVDWMGRTNDVSGALRGASIFVQSSRGEGFPFTLLEAMAFGVPCVAFACSPGVREIIRSGDDGLLIPPGDIVGLSRGIELLINNDRIRNGMGRRARGNVRRFSSGEYIRRWEELFSAMDQQPSRVVGGSELGKMSVRHITDPRAT
jgi:glycosyltransferase involved in cell wall biosynthesis